MSGVIALHRALYFPGSLVLCLAPRAPVQGALRQGVRLLPPASRDAGAGDGPQARDAPPERIKIEALPGSEKTVRGFSGTSS
jgi:hypothetical protein